MKEEKPRLLVLASGTGSLLQALLDSPVGIHICAVGSDVPQCHALERARRQSIPTFSVTMDHAISRDEWNQRLLMEIEAHDPTLIISAGFMRILGSAIVDRYAHRIINTHPALLPAFPGAHAVRDALAYGAKVTGCTVHFVDAGVDTGPIIAQQAVTIFSSDSEQSLHERIKEVERLMLVSVVEQMISEKFVVDGRKVQFT